MTDAQHVNGPVGEHPFSADRPILQRDEDLLGRREFAEALADSIKGWRERDSLVLGIYGRWGTGKTSLKNMVLETLGGDKDKAPHIVEFNPWQWSSQTQIAEAFFREIGLALGVESKSDADRKRAQKWLAYAAYLDFGSEAIAGLRRFLLFFLTISAGVLGSAGFFQHPGFRSVALILACIFAAAAAVLAWSKTLTEKLSKTFMKSSTRRERSLEGTRKELRELMVALPKPLLVVIDDIDRLAPRELKLVFQLVKSNADFPNLIYLLLFQRDIVERGLEDGPDKMSIVNGRDYLEKIVNVGFDLPLIEQSKIDRFLDQRIGQLFGSVEVSESERHRFANLYWGPLQHFFHDLRAAKRFLATLDFHLSLFRARGVLDVNVVDLLALEILRVFEPDAYMQLPAAKRCLTHFSDRIEEAERMELKATVDGILEKADKPNQGHVREILKEIFPRTQALFGDYSYGGGSEEEWYRDRRVCHSDVFDRYFLLRIAEGDISHGDIERLLAAAADKKRLLAELRALNKCGLLATMINRLEAYKQKVPLAFAVPFVAAFLDLEDEIPDDSSTWLLTPTQHISRIIYWFLKQEPDQQKRGQLFMSAVRESQGLLLVVAEAQSNDRKEKEEKERQDPQSFLIDEASSEELKALAQERIRDAAASGALIKSTRLQYLLYRWKAWNGPAEPTAWLRTAISSDDGLRRVLVEFLSRSTSHTMGARVGLVHWKFDLKNLEEYIPAEDFEARVGELNQSILNPMEQLAVGRFKKALARSRAGKPYGLNQIWRDDEDDE